MPVKILYSGPVSSFATAWFGPLIAQYLDFEPWDPDTTYPAGTLFYVNCLNYTAELARQLQDQGFKLLIDNLWEVDPGPAPGAHRITCDRWFWYNESLWYQHLELDQYRPQRDFRNLALMPMNRRRAHRDDFMGRIDLDRMLWSYVDAGRQLPGDKDTVNWETQRYMNPVWYDTTYLSMVVESLVRPGSKYTPTFVTEKTTKPLAFQHPFLVYGNRGTLRTLKNWGFETWSHLWDESYDEIQQADERGRVVAALLNSIEVLPHTPETLKKLQHNRNHFFDSALVRRGIIKEIIEPIIEYAEINR
jgi:hypothetical protein